MHQSCCSAALILAAGLVLAGCTAGLSPELPAGASTPSLPSLPLLTGSKITGSPTEVYTRIARGAVTCWFGASGPLKSGYIYHADATPDSKGGGAEITIFARDTSMSPDPRALKAFEISIRPTGGAPDVGIRNFKVPEPLAGRLHNDAMRWAEAEEGCNPSPITDGWSASDPPKKAGKAKAKRSAKK